MMGVENSEEVGQDEWKSRHNMCVKLTESSILWIVMRFCLTKGGIGLQQLFTPCTSRGRVSASDSIMWLGKRYLYIILYHTVMGFMMARLIWSILYELCLCIACSNNADLGLLLPQPTPHKVSFSFVCLFFLFMFVNLCFLIIFLLCIVLLSYFLFLLLVFSYFFNCNDSFINPLISDGIHRIEIIGHRTNDLYNNN